MKKIVLCSLVLCGMIYGNVSFAAATCRKTSSGEVVCNYIDTGGEPEDKLCYKLKSESATNPDSEVWDNFNETWWAKKVGQDCTNGKPGAKTAKCINNYHTQGSKTHTRSCAAYECLSDYLLYTTNKRKEIAVIGKNQKVGSQGLCRSKSYLKSLCDAGCGCGEKEECVLNEVTVKNHGKNVKAFIGEELCVCVAKDGGTEEKQEEQKPNVYPEEEQKPNVCPEKDCKDTCDVTIKESIKCNNGKKFESKKTVKVCKECVEQQKMTCEQYQETINKCDDLKCIENRLKQLTEIDKLLKEWCGSGYVLSTPASDNSAQITAAKNTVSSFFGSAESNKSVWKDAQGNFNTARLASDLTAGVVLGTVGGVVSGVVIKKKQVEKGFDALHCAVGGQTVADWGDTFNVGLRR